MAIARAVDRRLFLLIERARTRVFRDANNRLKDTLDLTATQAGALFYLIRHDDCRIGDMANGLGLGAPAATGLVARMEKAGFLTRHVEKDDARASRIRLTENGRAMADSAVQSLKQINESLAEGFDRSEMETIYRFLTACARGDYEGGTSP